MKKEKGFGAEADETQARTVSLVSGFCAVMGRRVLVIVVLC